MFEVLLSSVLLMSAATVPAHLVVIDPGHGGYQPGAKAGNGRYEKELSLTVAFALGEELRHRGYDVRFTREDDRFVSLFGRARIANNAHAELLISIHANDSPNRAVTGIETYFLSPRATDAAAETLAEKENLDQGDDDDKDELVDTILSDLRRSNSQIESELLATRIQAALIKATGTKNRGVKQAPLAVLKKAEMAAILVEVGFLTNAVELQNMWSGHYQGTLAHGIANGVDQFFSDTRDGTLPEIPPPTEAPYVSLENRAPASLYEKPAGRNAKLIAILTRAKIKRVKRRHASR